MKEGMTAKAAARQARLEFGGEASSKDGMRGSLGIRWMDELMADLVYAWRILRKSPSFTLIAVTSLALAIGANTVIFSFANQMLFVRLGVPRAEQLRMLAVRGEDGKDMPIHSFWGNFSNVDGAPQTTSFSWPVYQQLRKENKSLEEIFAFKDLGSVNLTAGGTAMVVKANLVSGNFYSQMQVRPELGRPLVEGDDGAPGTGTVAVISDGLWHRAFGGEKDVLGKTITVNLIPVTVVGVNPPGFKSPTSVTQPSPEVFLPLSMISTLHPSTGRTDILGPDMWWLSLMGRTKAGVSDTRSQTELDGLLNGAIRGTMQVKKDETVPHLRLLEGGRGDTSDIREFAKPVYVLLGLAGLVLLLACANIANLMLARAAVRQREMSVRMALGASRGRILRQVLTESLLVAALGGLGGLILGYLGRNLIPWLTSTSWQGGEILVSFDWRVFGFAAAATLVTGVLFGIFPAWTATHAEINSELKAGSRSATRTRKGYSGKAIVGFQVALSTMLVISAMFFLRTLSNLNSIDPGFKAAGLTLFDINPPVSRYKAPTDVALHQRLETAFAAIPGVEGVTATNVPLVSGSMWSSGFHVEGAPKEAPRKRMMGDPTDTLLSDVGQDFFKVMQIPMIAGRGFNAQDTATSVPVGVINQALAKKYFPGVNPIGKRYRMGDEGPDAKWIEVIGICADTKYQDMKSPIVPLHFELYRQMPEIDGVTYVIRSSLSADQLQPSLRRVLKAVDPDLPIAQFRTQQQQIAQSMQDAVMFASLTSGFGVLALLLACVGIYGIMAYTVSQRTSEIGIRLALGAVRSQVRGMILKETGLLAAIGVVVGLGVTLGLIRLVKTMLYGLSPYDPVTLGGSALLLLGMALVAGWVPANRASRVEPMEALRHD